MAKRIPAPTITFSTPKYKISNDTAVIKARRLMKELKEYGGAKNFEKIAQRLALHQTLPHEALAGHIEDAKTSRRPVRSMVRQGDQIMIKPTRRRLQQFGFGFWPQTPLRLRPQMTLDSSFPDDGGDAASGVPEPSNCEQSDRYRIHPDKSHATFAATYDSAGFCPDRKR